jgi:hypothetical protein
MLTTATWNKLVVVIVAVIVVVVVAVAGDGGRSEGRIVPVSWQMSMVGISDSG